MKTQVRKMSLHEICQTKPRDYRITGLRELCRGIAERGDPAALDEFHNQRRPFTWRSGQRLRFAEYVSTLGESVLSKRSGGRSCSAEIVDRAYNITVDKFYHLPGFRQALNRHVSRGESDSGESNIDCRYYFKAFLEKIAEVEESQSGLTQLEEEILAGRMLQGHVTRHFALSLKESRRSENPFVSRYEWKVNGRQLYVLFPRDFPGRQRRAWLEANVDDPDPLRPGEKQRVQGIIDRHMAKGRFVHLGEGQKAPGHDTKPFLSWAVMYGISAAGLAAVVAREKADGIERQRPAIRQLGSSRLREMILCIFERLDCGNLNAREIAARFGLSKATFSRFAGSDWHTPGSERKKASVPDLWLNVAHALSLHQGLVEAAQAAGVWPRVKQVLEQTRGTHRRGGRHV